MSSFRSMPPEMASPQENLLTLLIRTGRSPEYKRKLLQRLWTLFQTATGAPDDQIVIGIQEVAPSQAMEMAQIMPDVAGD